MDQIQNTATQMTTVAVDPSLKLDQLIVESKAKNAHVWGYVFWSLAIPPFSTAWAMYAAYKKGVLHELMPLMTIIYSILFILWSLLMFSAPGAVADYVHQQAVGVGGFEKVAAILLAVLGIAGGIYFRLMASKDGKLPTWVVIFLSVILLLQLVVGYQELQAVAGIVNGQINNNVGL